MGRLNKKRIPEIKEVIIEAKGNITKAAHALTVKRTALVDFVSRYEELQEVRDDIRNERTDMAEDKYWQAIERGESWAVSMELRTQGKDRGFTERQEVTGENGGPVKYEVVEKEWQQEQSKSNGHTNGRVSLLAARRNGRLSEPVDAEAKR